MQLSAVHRLDLGATVWLYALVALTLLIFWPGLTGPFLFDDFHNLKPLGAGSGIQSLADLGRFVFSGEAGALGRPISLLTFAMNDVGWPSSPWPFKYTNLLIHALNGVLVFVLSRQLAALTSARLARGSIIALGAAAIWLLHPLQLTPVFLVVQRMTELSALFVLAGLIAYMTGRRAATARPVRGYVLMSLAVVFGGTLSVLSKENGILLPLFILVIEATVGSTSTTVAQRPRVLWRALFLWAPLLLLAAYIARSLVNSGGGVLPLRDFTIAQRLLTEPRILLDYLRLVLVPYLGGSGLFHEDYVASKGLLTPLSTLPAIAALAASLGLALIYRRRYPVLAFAVLWFLAGHSLEAGPVNLELYFEHRNYLPLLGPAFAAAWYALHAPAAVRRFPVFGLAAFVALCALATWQASAVWGDFGRLATITAAENPRSIRAQQSAARYWFERGSPQRAVAYLRRGKIHHPNDIGLDLRMADVDCVDGRLANTDVQKIISNSRRGGYDNTVTETIKSLRQKVSKNRCKGLTLDDLLDVAHGLLQNPHFQFPKAKQIIYYEIAHIYAGQHLLNEAINAADQAYDASPDYAIAMRSAVWLLSAGLPDSALRYIQKAQNTTGKNLYELSGARQDEIKAFKDAAIKAQKSRQSSPASKATPRPKKPKG